MIVCRIGKLTLVKQLPLLWLGAGRVGWLQGQEKTILELLQDIVMSGHTNRNKKISCSWTVVRVLWAVAGIRKLTLVK